MLLAPIFESAVLFVKCDGVDEPGTEIVNAVGVRMIEFGKLLRKDIDG